MDEQVNQYPDEQEYRREEEARVERSVRWLFTSGARQRHADDGLGMSGVPVPVRPAPWQGAAHARPPLPGIDAGEELNASGHVGGAEES
jgi:hypothetical protein